MRDIWRRHKLVVSLQNKMLKYDTKRENNHSQSHSRIDGE